MKKIYGLQYCMEDGSVSFCEEEIDMKEAGKPFFNPVLSDNLNIDIFFPAQDQQLVKDMLIDCLSDFTLTSILVNKYCKNPYQCDFSQSEIDHIQRAAQDAIDSFLTKLMNDEVKTTQN